MAGHDLTDEQARWLSNLLQSGRERGERDKFVIPDVVHEVLAEKGLIQWKRNALEITLDGIKEVARRRRRL